MAKIYASKVRKKPELCNFTLKFVTLQDKRQQTSGQCFLKCKVLEIFCIPLDILTAHDECRITISCSFTCYLCCPLHVAH
jgi:hypothetical protein